MSCHFIMREILAYFIYFCVFGAPWINLISTNCQGFLLVCHIPYCPVGLKLGYHSSFCSPTSHQRPRQILHLPAAGFRY